MFSLNGVLRCASEREGEREGCLRHILSGNTHIPIYQRALMQESIC